MWSSPPDPITRQELLRWCDTVGAVFFQPRPSMAESGPIDRLAIVSWNVHEGGGDVDELVRRLRAGEFTGGQRIDHFVLLLQEATRQDRTVPPRIATDDPAPRRIAPRNGMHGADVHRFADQGFAVLYAPSMRNGRHADAADSNAEDRGNAIVSTLALARPRLIELPLEHQRRVVVAAAVEGLGGRSGRWRLDLIDVHLDTALALLHGGPFAARRRQATALLAALPAGDATATVLAGDLNTWRGRGEGAARVLGDAFSGTAAAALGPTWLGPLGLHASLDHLFVRGDVQAARVTRLASRFGSDHFPLLTVLRF